MRIELKANVRASQRVVVTYGIGEIKQRAQGIEENRL